MTAVAWVSMGANYSTQVKGAVTRWVMKFCQKSFLSHTDEAMTQIVMVGPTLNGCFPSRN